MNVFYYHIAAVALHYQKSTIDQHFLYEGMTGDRENSERFFHNVNQLTYDGCIY